MNLIGLPGQNPETRSWMETLTGSLELGQTATSVSRYRHWEEGGRPDIAHEANRLDVREGDLVIAKSMGTMVLLAGARLKSAPARAVFIGTPIQSYPLVSIEYLQEFANTIPSLFIQQTSDFTGDFEAVRDVVGETPRASLAEIEGADHMYGDTAELTGIIEDWWDLSV